MTFTPGRSEIAVRCHLHTDQYAPRGYCVKARRTPDLGVPFTW